LERGVGFASDRLTMTGDDYDRRLSGARSLVIRSRLPRRSKRSAKAGRSLSFTEMAAGKLD